MYVCGRAFELGYAFIRLQVAGSRFCALTKILHCCTLLSVLAYFLASVGLKAVRLLARYLDRTRSILFTHYAKLKNI